MYVEILSIYVCITTARNSFNACILMRILLICVDAEAGRSIIDERSVPHNIRKESWKSMTQILLKQNNCQAGYSELRRITEFNLKRVHFPPRYLSISFFFFFEILTQFWEQLFLARRNQTVLNICGFAAHCQSSPIRKISSA